MEEFNNLPEDGIDMEKKIENMSSPPTEEPSEEEPEESFDETLEKLKIRDRIIRYNVSFGKYLTVFSERMTAIDDMDLAQLKRLIREIEIAVSARTSGNMVRIYYGNAIQVTERLAPLIGMNLNGLTAVLTENEQINECLEELNIKYDVMHHVNPEIRLGFITLNAILAVNSQNKKINKVAEVLNQPVKEEHAKMYEDL